MACWLTSRPAGDFGLAEEAFEAGLRAGLPLACGGGEGGVEGVVEVLDAGEFVDEEEPVGIGIVGVAEGVFGLEGFAVVAQVEMKGVGEGGALGGSGDVGLGPAEDGFGEGKEGGEFTDRLAGAVLGEEVEEGAVPGEEVLVDVGAGFEEGWDGDDQTFGLDVAEPLFVRELFRGFGHGLGGGFADRTQFGCADLCGFFGIWR
jgi:hypothetical protein